MATKRSVGELKESDLKGKRVFVRVDLNVPLDDNLNITDDTRVRAAVPTIKYLMSHGAKVILSTHLVTLIFMTDPFILVLVSFKKLISLKITSIFFFSESIRYV